MAETVKKSRIVSDEDLEESLMEEFNLRLKSCLSQGCPSDDDDEERPQENFYENVQIIKSITKTSSVSEFIENERLIEQSINNAQNGNAADLIYENVTKQSTEMERNGEPETAERIDETEKTERVYESAETTERCFKTTETTERVYEIAETYEGVREIAETYEDVHEIAETNESNAQKEDVEIAQETMAEEKLVNKKPSFTLVASESVERLEIKTAKDKMLLSTDDVSCLLFSQTVTSPMLTPSEENVDFLKGFEESAPSDGSTETSDDKTNETDDKTNEIDDKTKDVEFIPDVVDDKTDEVPDVQPETDDEVAEAPEDSSRPLVDCANVDERHSDPRCADVEFLTEAAESPDRYEPIEIDETDDLRADFVEDERPKPKENGDYFPAAYKVPEKDIVASSKSIDELRKTIVESKDEIVKNREKDTETVPAKIVRNLTSQFMKVGDSGDEESGDKKRTPSDIARLKPVDIMNKISKFEHKSDVDVDSTQVTETYVETTTVHSNAEEKVSKKKKTKKSRKEEKENISVKSSFSKFDAIQKKNALQLHGSEAQAQCNGNQMDTSKCKSCTKPVFQMEQIKAEKAIWHKNCFRCNECSKQLNVDTYESHEGQLYCKPHFKSLFAPKVVEDQETTSDKPDLGLEELQSLNVKERFQVFQQQQLSETNTIEKNSVNVKRSPSILSKLAKFQQKGMDVGVSDEALNGIPIEESSSEEEEEEMEEGEDADLIRAKKVQKEKPFHFSAMSDVKSKWEHGDQSSKDERREERKQEIQSIRNRLFMGKQGKMKEAYQEAVMKSESCINLKKDTKIEVCDTKSIKERFEKGEVVQEMLKDKDDEDSEVFESEISKKSRSLFLELDANASKPPQISASTPKLEVKKARELATPERELYRDPDVVRSEELVEDSVIAKETHTATKMLNKFRQMEENLSKEPVTQGPKPLKRFTPPPEPARLESSSEDEGSASEDEIETEEIDHSKAPDEDLLEAQKAARAKQLRAKFEKWEANEIKREQNNSINIMEEYSEEQIESTKLLRARFESMRETHSEIHKPRVKVNRFVDSNIIEQCEGCNKRVYALEKISVHGHLFHKSCFKCKECSTILRMDSYTYNQGRLYCTPHFKRLFISKGNYDSAFGLDQNKEKWNAVMA